MSIAVLSTKSWTEVTNEGGAGLGCVAGGGVRVVSTAGGRGSYGQGKRHIQNWH